MDPNDPEEAARRKKTLLLLVGGAASLVIPLLGVLYLRWTETRNAPKQIDPQGVFAAREGERRITPPAAPAMSAAVAVGVPAQSPSAAPPPMTPLPGSKSAEGNGSLGFIKPSEDYFAEKKAAPAPEPKKEEPKPAPPPEEPKSVAKTSKPAKPAKKTFAMPKLNTTKGFTSFKRNSPGQQGEEAAGGESPADMQEMLKQIPGGANNPEVQKFLKNQGN